MGEKSSERKNTKPKVVKGVASPSMLNPHLKHILAKKRKPQLDIATYIQRIREGDKNALAQAITIVESTHPSHQQKANEIIQHCLPFANGAIRIGVTGTPGVGKSTFIETLGTYLIEAGKRVAILAVDPSSQISKGSILGDKTRMERLSHHKNAFIRPSPTQLSLGGVAKKTREAMVLCEAAGHDIIIVETVGVGQSETLVHSMVDFFLLLILPGSGDELQGIKRGIVEMADLVVINKADGDRIKLAKKTKTDYRNAIHLFPPKESQWIVKVMTCSALEKKGIEKINESIEAYFQLVRKNNYFDTHRMQQAKYWLKSSINQGLQAAFYQHDTIKYKLQEIEQAVINNDLSPFQGASYLLNLFKNQTDEI